MSNPRVRYHSCFNCHRKATSAVIARTIRLPNGSIWAMYACDRHNEEMHIESDRLLGTGNGVMRIFSSGTGHYEVGGEQAILDECDVMHGEIVEPVAVQAVMVTDIRAGVTDDEACPYVVTLAGTFAFSKEMWAALKEAIRATDALEAEGP